MRIPIPREIPTIDFVKPSRHSGEFSVQGMYRIAAPVIVCAALALAFLAA
jgi:hypothetical protein